MTIGWKFTWTKIGIISTILFSIFNFANHQYDSYKLAEKAKTDSAVHAAQRQDQWNAYRMDMEKRMEVVEHSPCSVMCVDSMKDAINELDNKTHLKPKF